MSINFKDYWKGQLVIPYLEKNLLKGKYKHFVIANLRYTEMNSFNGVATLLNKENNEEYAVESFEIPLDDLLFNLYLKITKEINERDK